MAYEVVKTIGTRQYRYQVQSERDPGTGKTRNRWTYLGRVVSEPQPPAVRAPRPNARLRLLEAAETLMAGGDAAAVTVDAITAAAGVAHGTFYRYFRDRSSALEALARHMKEDRGIGDDRLLRADVESVAAARAGARAWVEDKLRTSRGLRRTIIAWYALMASDARLAAYREERREGALARLRDHLERLAERGFADIADAAATAAGIVALIDGITRTSILERDRLDDAAIAAVADIVERAIFARLEPAVAAGQAPAN
jgi:TetR/AcrR family transcriptional repressor of nem operon